MPAELADLRDVLLRTDIEKLTILPSGSPHVRATELLASDAMNRLLDDLSRLRQRVLVVQFGGAALAALLLRWVLPSGPENASNLGVPALGSGIGSGAGVVIEAVITFFLIWVIFASAVDPRGSFQQISGLGIGFTIAFGVLMAYGLTGGAMNPARAFGPQLVGNHWSHFWVWYVGPFAGAVIAASVYELLYLRPARPVPVGPPESGVDEPRPGDAALS